MNLVSVKNNPAPNGWEERKEFIYKFQLKTQSCKFSGIRGIRFYLGYKNADRRFMVMQLMAG
jgi:hypothetical protein